jgi:hypothetical protein
MSNKNLKVCTVCKEEKSIIEFNKNKIKSDGLQTQCRDCGKKKSINYYNSNKEYHKQITVERHKKQSIALQQYVYNYLLKNGCFDCKENDPRCLDFDHQRDKKQCISRMVNNGCAFSTLLEEIEKCVIRCANCHRKKTAKDFNWYKNINAGL